MLLKPADHEKIKAAIEAAEARTSGEVYGVVARECSDYWEVPLAWGVIVALLAPAVAFLLGWGPDAVTRLTGGWTAAHATEVDAAVGQALIVYVTAQAVLFVLTVVIVSIPPIRRLLTPGPLKRERVHRRALEQFAAQGIHLTSDRSGVLIFASLMERRVSVIADAGVIAKLGPEPWSKVVACLVKGMKKRDPGTGFAEAIAAAADVMAAHCPRRADDKNELPDTVIEIDV
jgi:putative membrane protein